MLKRIKPWTIRLSAIISVSSLLSCGTPKAVEYRDFSNFRIKKIGVTNTQVKLDLRYYNPNNFGLQLKRTEVNIQINGTHLGSTSQDYQIEIPRKSDFVIPIVVDVDMKNLAKNSWTALTNKEVTVRVTGKLKIGKANVFVSYPIDYEGKHQLMPF